MQGPQGPQGAAGVVTGTFGKTVPFTMTPLIGFSGNAWFAFDHVDAATIAPNASVAFVSQTAFVIDRAGTIDKLSVYAVDVARDPGVSRIFATVARYRQGDVEYVDQSLNVTIADGTAYYADASTPFAVLPGDRIAVKIAAESAALGEDAFINGGAAVSIVYRYAV